MDLALEMGGMTAAGLSRVMSERELGDWARYRSRRMLPSRRIEVMLARVCLAIARSVGDQKLTVSDFLIDSADHADAPDEVDDAEITPADVAAQFGGTVYRKKKVS